MYALLSVSANKDPIHYSADVFLRLATASSVGDAHFRRTEIGAAAGRLAARQNTVFSKKEVKRFPSTWRGFLKHIADNFALWSRRMVA